MKMCKNLILFIFPLIFSTMLTADITFPWPTRECGENETYRQCGTACEPTCTNRNPICITLCVPGCNCNRGFVREDGKCIPVSQCSKRDTNDTKKCDENEELRSCPGCESKCDISEPRLCPLICRLGKECECKKGYSRTDEGKCVPRSDCPGGGATRPPRDLDCDENERIVYCSGCEAQCGRLDVMCPMVCNGIRACECKRGYARDPDTKKCIPIEECNDDCSITKPPRDLDCDENEREVQCSGCEAECGIEKICTEECNNKPACECKPGYSRDPNTKECIPTDECDAITTKTPRDTNLTCGKNERVVECSGCEKTCSLPSIACKKICNHIPACECKRGYYRDEKTKECVKLCDCTENEETTEYPSTTENPSTSERPPRDTNLTCDEFEHEVQCSGCEKTCSDPDKICTLECNNIPACECKPGFYRDEVTKKCVRLPECDSGPITVRPPRDTNLTCGENEEEVDCSGCENTCSNPDKICTLECNNIPACECEPDYYRDEKTKKCVKLCDCTGNETTTERPPRDTNLTCGENEEKVQCSGCEKTCSDPGKICTLECNNIPACECKPGFFRDEDNKKCVRRPECKNGPVTIRPPRDTNLTCDENEQEVECSGCEAECDNLDRFCTLECNNKPACECKPGYARDEETKKCIRIEKCKDHKPKECPRNEEWLEACGACEGTCDNPEPRFCTADCKPAGCYCVKRGYVRGPNGRCIHRRYCRMRNPRNDTGEPTNPCAVTLCPVGTKCVPKTLPCLIPPCPRRGECIPTRPPRDVKNPFCERARCANGPCLPVAIKCKTLNDCEYVGQCIDRDADPDDFDVCENSTCPEGSKCYAQNIQCFRPPCLDIPRCVKNSRFPRDGCESLNCTEDQECIKIPIYCIRAPCPPIEKCIDIKDFSKKDLCKSIDCPNGQKCVKKDVVCVRAPCPPVIECVDKDKSVTSKDDDSRDTKSTSKENSKEHDNSKDRRDTSKDNDNSKDEKSTSKENSRGKRDTSKSNDVNSKSKESNESP